MNPDRMRSSFDGNLSLVPIEVPSWQKPAPRQHPELNVKRGHLAGLLAAFRKSRK